MPRTVWIRRGSPPVSSFCRILDTCTSSEFDSGPVVTAHTASASCSYVTSCPRLRISAARIRNSMPVSPSCRPPLVARQHQVEKDDVGVPLAHELEAAAGRIDRPHRIPLLAQAGRDRPREAAIIFDQGDFPSDRHLELRRNSPMEPAEVAVTNVTRGS